MEYLALTFLMGIMLTLGAAAKDNRTNHARLGTGFRLPVDSESLRGEYIES